MNLPKNPMAHWIFADSSVLSVEAVAACTRILCKDYLDDVWELYLASVHSIFLCAGKGPVAAGGRLSRDQDLHSIEWLDDDCGVMLRVRFLEGTLRRLHFVENPKREVVGASAGAVLEPINFASSLRGTLTLGAMILWCDVTPDQISLSIEPPSGPVVKALLKRFRTFRWGMGAGAVIKQAFFTQLAEDFISVDLRDVDGDDILYVEFASVDF